MSQVLNSQAVVAYHELQWNNIKVMLKNLLDHPEMFDHHILRYVAFCQIKFLLMIVAQPSVHYSRSCHVRSQCSFG